LSALGRIFAGLAAAILTDNTILALIVIALAAVGLLLPVVVLNGVAAGVHRWRAGSQSPQSAGIFGFTSYSRR
jgi:hypothetical protein